MKQADSIKLRPKNKISQLLSISFPLLFISIMLDALDSKVKLEFEDEVADHIPLERWNLASCMSLTLSSSNRNAICNLPSTV